MSLSRLTIILGCCIHLSLQNEISVPNRDVDESYLDNFDFLGTNQRMAWHTVAVLGEHLYIEGGQLSTWVNGKFTNSEKSLELNRTLSVPLNTKWTPKNVNITEIPYAKGMPAANYPGLWADEQQNSLYRWGGELPRSKVFEKGHETELYVLKTDGKGGGTWTTKSLPSSVSSGRIQSNSYGAPTSCNGTGFYIGGYSSNSTGDYRLKQKKLANPGVVTYDVGNDKLFNVTAPTLALHDDNLQSAQAVCVTGFQDDPLLLVLGGLDAAKSTDRSMEAPIIYDTKSSSQTWHYQQQAGDGGGNGVPLSRFAFCAVGAQGKNGTYEIFIYGGYSKDSGQYFSDVWVLSLPAFKWFKAAGSGEPRRDLACAAVGRHMISVGGSDATGTARWNTDDPWEKTIGVFDMVTLTWTHEFDPSKEYDTPDIVKSWYSKNNVDVDVVYADGIKELFPLKTDTTKVPSNISQDGSKTPVGAIVGGVIGALAFIGLAVAGLLAFRRYREQHKEEQYFMNLSNQTPGSQPQNEDWQHKSPFLSSPTYINQPVGRAGWVDGGIDSTAMSEMDGREQYMDDLSNSTSPNIQASGSSTSGMQRAMELE